jgi:hypothetical protein
VRGLDRLLEAELVQPLGDGSGDVHGLVPWHGLGSRASEAIIDTRG